VRLKSPRYSRAFCFHKLPLTVEIGRSLTVPSLRPPICTTIGCFSASALYSAQEKKKGCQMPLFYFDLKGDVPSRDHKGELCASAADAIIRAARKALEFAKARPSLRDGAHFISVLDQNGTEIHQEPVD
jgi:hypothetical protein